MSLESRDLMEVQALLRLKGDTRMGDRAIRRLVEAEGSGIRALRAAGRQLDLLGPDGEDETDLDSWSQEGIQAVPMTANRYPASLKELLDPPPVLFMMGNSSLLSRPSVAIVGSRKATEGGRRSAEIMGRVLSEAGVNVVSGMALGIDGASHRGALKGGGVTTAVLGSGFHTVYPAAHRSLFRDIAAQGLVVTEFLPGERALPHHFPKRNRVIAALASVVIVVEAGRRSGALITVDHALDLGREVWAVPGSVENLQAAGSNLLLRDGARALTDPSQVLRELEEAGLVPSSPHDPEASSTADGSGVPCELLPLWTALSSSPLGVDEVAERASRPLPEVVAGLSALEVGGWVRRCPGMRFCRS